ncbi:MAG: addiction module protein [Gammaproteobacteria bacterium]|nr:addiction module protein [Gammaproteobacteria bacterium]
MKIQELTLQERLRLVEQIWDSIADEEASIELPEAHREVLEVRLEAYRKSGDRGVPAAEAIERIRSRL